MKKSILSLEGVEVLSKKQMEVLNGGALALAEAGFNGSCTLRITEGGNTYLWSFYSNAGNGSGVSAAANSECMSIINGGASRCQYDCAYDGRG